MGTSSFLIQDQQSRILVDGFFTRNAGGRVGPFGVIELFLNPFAQIESNITAVTEALNWLSVPNTSNHGRMRQDTFELDAVIAVHSHHDHAMDVGTICQSTSCGVIAGSNSTANIARGAMIEENKLFVVKCAGATKVISPSETFEITMLASRHVPLPIVGRFILNSTIPEPMKPSSHLRSYKEGCSYSVLVQHKETGMSMLIQGSANSISGALDGVTVDVLFLSIAGLSMNGEDYMESYWRNVVETVKPKLVIPIHWDDFSVPYTDHQKPTNQMEFWTSLKFVELMASKASPPIDVVWMPVRSSMDLQDLVEMAAARFS